MQCEGSAREAAGSGGEAENQVEPGLEADLLDRRHQRQVGTVHQNKFLDEKCNFFDPLQN